MDFVVYETPPLELSGSFHRVSPNDPIRRVLMCFTSFEDMVERLAEQDFDNYGVFLRFRNPRNQVVYKQTSFFFQKPRLSSITPVPIPPFYIYRRTISPDMTPFLWSHQSWLVKTVVHRLFSFREDTLVFAAGDQTRTLPISPFLKQELSVIVEPVPLLVLDNPEHSLDFAAFVIGMLHQTSVEEIQQYMEAHQSILKTISVDHRRKMYDIFPEEFIQIPRHVGTTLKSLDDAELLEADVEELCEKYKKLTLTPTTNPPTILFG